MWGVIVFCGVTAAVSRAQVTFATLAYFNGPDGTNPQYVVPVQGADGNLYGTTSYGGAGDACRFNCGTVFKTTTEGTVTTLYSFCSKPNCTDGDTPLGSLIQAPNGEFYGTTAWGGANNGGTVFKITSTGKLTTLYSFCTLANCADGQGPYAGLVRAANGNFYGTTSRDAGTVFEITPEGKLTTLSVNADGPSGALVQARSGNFYGEDEGGEGTDAGNIFEITSAGKLIRLFTFDGSNGAAPNGGLIQATNGNFYGVTAYGGSSYNQNCNNSCGTVFEVTPAGKLTTLYNFCSLTDCADGFEPMGPLVQATDGNLYGATMWGGTTGSGTLFKITPGGTLTTLYSFCTQGNCPDGFSPFSGPIQATNGIFYGTTYGNYDGLSPYGTLFSLSTGLRPFVKTQPTSAEEGATIGILGQGFTSSSVVEFSGVRASSINISGTTFLTATVPAGALTGLVSVTTGATTLTSNQEFRVTPQVLNFDPMGGSVGTQVTITGVGFTQTLGVGFGDNISAAFTVNSDTQLTATVPAGAKTGPNRRSNERWKSDKFCRVHFELKASALSLTHPAHGRSSSLGEKSHFIQNAALGDLFASTIVLGGAFSLYDAAEFPRYNPLPN